VTELERYLASLDTQLRVGRRTRARILSEVRDQLDEDITGREDRGDTHQVAVAHALHAFGAPTMMATAFNNQAGTRAMHRHPFVILVGGVAVCVGFLVAATTQASGRSPQNATVAAQVSFFVAALAMQAALVAGICATSRAVARWHAAETSSDDRRFVHRCSIVSLGALTAATSAWVANLGLASNTMANANKPTLAIGAAIMILAVIMALVILTRLPINPFDDPPAEHANGIGVLGLGEDLIGIVRSHPVVSCVAAALVTGGLAMSHAETTFTGALPWGVVQAGAVLIGFALLGPALGLRETHAA
jgi:hypothetical protein